MTIDRLDRLEAVEAIRNLKARYFYCLDCKQWDALAELFTDDMQVISPNGEIWMSGGEAFARSLQQSLENSISRHQGFTAEIDILDENTAKGIWAMQDIIEWHERHPREGWKAIVGSGHYHETYRRIQGKWQIASLCLKRISLDIED